MEKILEILAGRLDSADNDCYGFRWNVPLRFQQQSGISAFYEGIAAAIVVLLLLLLFVRSIQTRTPPATATILGTMIFTLLSAGLFPDI